MYDTLRTLAEQSLAAPRLQFHAGKVSNPGGPKWGAGMTITKSF
jgi:hypothetical protein